jgi:diguanylate cyclase (GGDEF)-like protein
MSVPPGLRAGELSIEGLTALGAGNACDLEPIHLSGAVQPYGFLLAVDSVSHDVVAASANAAQRLGLDADGLLGRELCDVLGPDVADALLTTAPTANPHEALSLRVCIPTRANGLIVLPAGGPAGAVAGPDAEAGGQPGTRTTPTYDIVWHTRDGVLLLEFEPSDAFQTDTYYLQQRNATRLLSSIDDVETICQVAAQEVRNLTGYDRVMVYRFDADAHGCVIAEARHEQSQPFLGLHYPAGDIPRQARALYLRNWIRVIGDVDYEPVPIVAVADRLPGDQLDLSMSVLRSVSPTHLQYLRNMGVRATMTISLIVDNQLWGMIACHHDSRKQLTHLERLACEGLGQLISVRIRATQALEEHTRATTLGRLASEVVAAMAAGENPATGAAAARVPLLAMVGADAAVVQVDGQRCVVGPVPDEHTLDLVVDRLAVLAGGGPNPFSTDALPDLLRGRRPSEPGDAASTTTEAGDAASTMTEASDLDALAAVASGAMLLPLPGHDVGFVLWLRTEQARTVRWAGRPQPKPEGASGSDEPLPLSPRASFAEWREHVRYRSMPWREAEIAAATELAQAMPEVFLHRSQNRLFRFALHDPLTGLPNRLLLQDRLDGLLRQAAEDGRLPMADAQLAVLFIDLDGFKIVNDTLGHAAGDELLTLVAHRLGSVIRPQDMVARMSGDEFVVLVPGVDEAEATLVGQRLVEVCRRPFLLAGEQNRSVTASIGLTMITSGTEPGEALRQADAALYHAKRAGRDQLAIYNPGTGTATSRRQLDGAELAAAMADGQLLVHYQPIVNLQGTDGPTLDGFEALVRWPHPSRGLVPPDQFIRLAEQVDLIDKLGDFVLNTALRQLQAWPDARLTMAVNISTRQLTRPGFTEEVLAQLTECGVAPGRLCLEIAESQLMEQPALALAVLTELDACGLQLAIDDFGTGFTSLAYIRNLPAARLKIDRSFIAGLPGEPKDVAVVAATVTLARALGMRTVAEGVETEEQLVALHGLGADLAQGFLLGRPAPASAVALDALRAVLAPR